MMPGGPLGGTWGGKGDQGGGRRGGNLKTLYCWRPLDRLWTLFGATNAKMGALLGPTRFRRGATIEQFLTKSIQGMKNYDQERFQEKHQILIDFQYQNKRHEKVENALYLLHFKRLRGVTKLVEQWTFKCHEQSTKIKTLCTIGGDSWD